MATRDEETTRKAISSVQFNFLLFLLRHMNKILRSLCVVKNGVRKGKKQQNKLTL